jgi:hypothetical protein
MRGGGGPPVSPGGVAPGDRNAGSDTRSGNGTASSSSRVQWTPLLPSCWLRPARPRGHPSALAPPPTEPASLAGQRERSNAAPGQHSARASATQRCRGHEPTSQPAEPRHRLVRPTSPNAVMAPAPVSATRRATVFDAAQARKLVRRTRPEALRAAARRRARPVALQTAPDRPAATVARCAGGRFVRPRQAASAALRRIRSA